MTDDGAASPTWLTSVLWQDSENVPWWTLGAGAEHYVAVPNVASAQQLLPWRMSSALAATRRISDDRAPAMRWRDAAAVTGVLAVSPFSSRRRLSLRGTASLIDQVSELLDARGAAGVVMAGPPRANQKPVIQLHDRAGRTIAYVKVAWNDLTRKLLTDERIALETLAAREDREFTVPPILGTGEFGSSTWMAIGPVSVARRHRPDLRAVDRVASLVEGTAPAWHGLTREATFVTKLVAQSGTLEIGRRAVESLLSRESERPISVGASHGDFVPWNMLSGHPHAAVWDWERYSTAEPVGVDRLHYRFQMGIQRRHLTVAEALTSIHHELDSVLPDVSRDCRGAHLDWYIVNLLCRYERDSYEQPIPRLRERIADLTGVLNQRGVLP